jgi:hypothetical protein
MKNYLKYLIPWFVVLLLLSCRKPDMGNPREIDRPPRIEPDYTEIMIPPNIAPLNFVIKEPARQYCVEVDATQGKPIKIFSHKPEIRFPLASWKKLLQQNKGEDIRFIITIQDDQNQWVRYQPFRNHIAREEIDPYLVYRLMPPLYIYWKRMGIYQRNLENFDVEQILNSKPLNDGCFNCHCFLHNSPDNWIVHLRMAPATGMLLTTGGKTVLVKTQTEFNRAPAGHPAWHPSGKYLAFSVYKVRQFFHAEGVNRDALDLNSDIILYKVESNTITACQSIADTNRLETYPAWSTDGNWLYFCSTPRFDTLTVLQNQNYKNIRYDLVRVGFDQQQATFGKPETFLSATETGLSITFPRFSPDGRFLLFSMSEYGNFPLARSGGHLYIMDMQSRQYRKLECNGERSDSYHSWSSNGHWIVFSSRRDDGISARPYFSYLDGQGHASKAFILPQEDPAFYESELQTFNIPELITGPIKTRPQELLQVARNTNSILKAKFVRSEE